MRLLGQCSVFFVLGLVGCATAPPLEPLERASLGEEPSYVAGPLVSGGALVEGGLCRAREGRTQRQCETVLSLRHFDEGAAAHCGTVGDDGQFVDCLVEIADQTFGVAALEACGRLTDDTEKVRCVSYSAGRTLSRGQFSQCRASSEDEHAFTKCVRDATDYVFDPEVLHGIAARSSRSAKAPPGPSAELQRQLQEWITLEPEARERIAVQEQAFVEARQGWTTTMFAQIQDAVSKQHPGTNISEVRNDFVFNFAGGANGQMQLLYCSPKEYLIIFGSPMSVNAYSGRYAMDVHDWVVAGRMEVYEQGDHVPENYYPGTHAYLASSETRTYTTYGPTYMLEYARGPINRAFDFGIRSPARNITRDKHNARDQIRACKRIWLKEWGDAPRRVRKAKRERKALRKQIRRELDTVE